MTNVDVSALHIMQRVRQHADTHEECEQECGVQAITAGGVVAQAPAGPAASKV